MTSLSALLPSRDIGVSIGRAKIGGSSYFTIPGTFISVALTNTRSADEVVYTPWITKVPIVIDQIKFEVTTAVAGNARVGIYAADADWQPISKPLVDSGDIDTSTTGEKVYGISPSGVYLPPGRYLSVLNCSAAPTLRYFRGSPAANSVGSTLGASSVVGELVSSQTYGAFPNPGTTWSGNSSSSIGFGHYLLFRISAL